MERNTLSETPAERRPQEGVWKRFTRAVVLSGEGAAVPVFVDAPGASRGEAGGYAGGTGIGTSLPRRAAEPERASHRLPREESRPGRLRLEIALSAVGIVVTLVATTMVGAELFTVLREQLAAGQWAAAAGHILFTVIIAFLIYGGLVYQSTRLLYLRRRLRHRPASNEALESLFDGDAPSLTILVPSYKEDPRVVRQTLLSAALQEYPQRRVVLLLDDPPQPSNPEDIALLAAGRRLPAEVQALLDEPAWRLAAARRDFLRRRKNGPLDPAAELATLSVLCEESAQWFADRLREMEASDHVDHLFRDRILVTQRDRLYERAVEFLRLSHSTPESSSPRRIQREYNRLASLFRVEVTSFERKGYENLSHEPNKAMNLNSYIGLLGGSYRSVQRDGKRLLEPASGNVAELHVPNSDYLITLDADSLILPDYALRLVQYAERSGNERIAVAQTPYSAIPQPPGLLERIAGATTDIQYIIHQGFTAANATFWVGANALLRTSALADIAVTEEERGYPVTRFIQDRTVIEDTESTVDLVARGWRLYNYPERLAFSATPPDFGSLIIQRRRWANGGLIILPKLLRYLLGGRKGGASVAEAWMRIHYLTSIMAVNFGLLIILAIPFAGSIHGLWLPMTSIPYFVLFGRDLRLIGYRRGDLARVYALNLLLIPVNLGGVCKSLHQAWTKEKIPFGRTPKVQGRTAAAALYVVAPYLLIVHWLGAAGLDAIDGHYAHALFAAANAAMLAYAIVAFVGVRESVADLKAAVRARREKKGLQVPTPVVAGVSRRGGMEEPALTACTEGAAA